MTPATRSTSLWDLPTRGAPPIEMGAAGAEQGRPERTRDKPVKWHEELRKAGAAVMICWALSGGPNQDIAAPTQTPEPAAHRSSGAITATVETGTVRTATTPENRRLAHQRLANARRNELNTVLNSMLITQRVEPGTPFEERSGYIPDERIRNIVKKIDDRLGGRIEWPNIHLVDGLVRDENASGQYSAYTANGETAPPSANHGREPADRFGIRLDKELVEDELRTGRPQSGISIESLLIHELQHATSHDQNLELRAKANATDRALVALPNEDIAAAARTVKPEYGPTYPTSESRAGLAMILHREIEVREKLGGPKLNELPQDERRAAVAGILMQYLENHGDRDQNEAELLGALKDPKYLRDFGYHDALPNPIWEPNIDASRTVDWARGLDVIDHRPRDISPIDHIAANWTDLPGMARRWTNGDSHGTPYDDARDLTLEEMNEQLRASAEKLERLEKPLSEPATEWRTTPGRSEERRPGTANLTAARPEKTPDTAARRDDRGTTAAAKPGRETTAAAEPDTPRARPTAAETGPNREAPALAHLKRLLHARHSRAAEAAPPSPKTKTNTAHGNAESDDHEFTAPSGRYSSGRSAQGERVPVRGGGRAVGGNPREARSRAADRAGTR